MPMPTDNMNIGPFCNRHVVTATRDTTVAEAAHLMRHHHVGDVVVVDELDGGNVPVGIVTDRDIVVGVVAAGLDPAVIRMEDLLQRPLVVAEERAGYAETVRAMSARAVRRMPVIDAAGKLVGIVTLDDLFHQLVGPLAELASVPARERRDEIAARR